MCTEHEWVTERAAGSRANDSNPGEMQSKGTLDRNECFVDTCSRCGAWRGELGLEPTPELYVDHLVQIFREVRRVLRDDGTLWLNLGDSFVSSPAGNKTPSGISQNTPKRLGKLSEYNTQPKRFGNLKPKDLVGIPWRVAFALQADGWYLRSDIIWAKPNPMPESVRDRPTKAHEYIFLLSKNAKYYYDREAIREPIKKNCDGSIRAICRERSGPVDIGNGAHIAERVYPSVKGANRRTVWTINTRPYKGAHFATFPPKLIEPCILAGCPQGGTVLDPFNGAGTTGLVALQHGRDYIGIELKQEYIEMTKERLAKVQLKAGL